MSKKNIGNKVDVMKLPEEELSIQICTLRDGNIDMVHPFIAEGIQNLRRNSSTKTHRNIKLNFSYNHQTEKENEVNPLNFDENYLMFGRDKYKKV